MVPRPHLSFCACKTTWLASELLASLGPSPHLWFLHANQRLLDQIYNSSWVPVFACWFVNEKWSLDPEWRLSIAPSIHQWFCAFKTATLASELLVSMGPWLLLLICECKTAWIDSEWRLSIGPSLNLWFCALKTATLASESIVSMGPKPHLWLFRAKHPD